MPGFRHNAGKLTLFDIQHTHAEDFFPPVFLQVHRLVCSMLVNGCVIQPGYCLQSTVIDRQIRQFALVCHPVITKGQHPVGIEQVRLELVNHLIHALQPVLLELLVPGIPGRQVFTRSVFLVCVIEVLVCRIIAVIRYAGIGTGLVAALVHPPPGEGSSQVFADAERQLILVRRRLPQGQDILVGTHIHAVHAVEFGIIVEEMIMMGCLGHQVPGSCLVILCDQCVRIKLLRLPQGADILVSEFGRMAVVAQMILILRLALDIHVPRIPVAEHRHALRSPVAPDSEFGVPEPFRCGILSQ